MNFKVSELIEKIERNRSEHRAIFEEAVKGYRETMLRTLDEHMKEVRSGKIISGSIYVEAPSDHTKDYDIILAMLKMTRDETIELDSTRFRCYVLDDWKWKRQFLQSTSAYSGAACDALEALGNQGEQF
jgi:hypothetical protein